jgi:hypothetical protein
MNLDDVEAQLFAESPNADGAVDQSIRADFRLELCKCSEDETQRQCPQLHAQRFLSPALRLQFRRNYVITTSRACLELDLGAHGYHEQKHRGDDRHRAFSECLC